MSAEPSPAAAPAPANGAEEHAQPHEQKITPWEVQGEVDAAGHIKEIDYNVGISAHSRSAVSFPC